jgi:DNA repair exonuclease SbcCD ATPase subunit
LTRELDIHTSEMNKIQADFQKEYEKIRTNTEVETEIQEKESELSGLKKALEKHEENSKKIEAYKRYKEELGKYQEWKTKVDTLTETEKNTRQKYVASTMMKQKILEAESIAILNIINSINLHAQEYLDLFFPTDPIVVRLLPFKQTKKDASKPQINLEIDYKGMEADISTLSGGELSRVVLAYTLALAEIFNSPLILLDECTASLDQDLATAVMEGIKKNFGNKLVVIIAHQIISGDFDKQISL